MMEKKLPNINIVTIVMAGITAVAIFAILLAFDAKQTFIMTFDDIPDGAIFIEHEHVGAEEKEEGRVEMRHYATPEDYANGGPIFGMYGYQVVSIEYDVPVSSIQERPVGEELEGYLLATKEIAESRVRYDHFHIGTSKEHGGELTYLIHLMLIPHEEELQYGLECS